MISLGTHAVVLAAAPLLAAPILAAPLRAAQTIGAPLLAVAGSVPVDPDAPTARQWLHDELTNPIYHQGPSLLERFLTWLQDLFQGVSVVGISGGWAALLLVAIVVVIAAVALYVSGPLRRTRRTQHAPTLAVDDTRTADELVAAAARAAAAGDFTAATLDTFRALARRSEERALIDPAPGRTAHEAAEMIGIRLPHLAPALAAGASTFDAIYYGKVPADAGSYEQMRGLETSAATARPTAMSTLAAAPGGVAAL